MSGAAGAAGAPRDASRKLVGILCAVGAALAWGAGATTSDFVLKGGVGNDTFLVLELGIGFTVVMVIAALRGEFGGFRHPNIGRAALTGLIVAILSFQAGAAVAKHVMPVAGAPGTAALRLGLSALIVCAWRRPWRRPTLRQVSVSRTRTTPARLEASDQRTWQP